MRLTLESCSLIYTGSLQKTFKNAIKRDCPEITPEGLYEKVSAELHAFSVNNQTFKYEAIKNKLGGHRWFFICPKCKQRASKLFLPPIGNSSYESKYLCKHCHKIKNQSAVMGQNRIYQNVTKPLKRLREIEKKLENGYLGTEKIKGLLDEYEEIEGGMKDSPEYRLYLFKKQRGIK
jgi:hypothetical protein